MTQTVASSQVYSLQQFFDVERMSAFQKLLFVLMFLIAFFDGYDTAIIGYVGSSLIHEWGISKADLPPVLSAALLGLALGAISSGPIADKLGRRWPLIGAVLLFALGSLASSQVSSLKALEYWRFVTGIGLGAAMPNAVTLLSEFSPNASRARIVNTMFCGFPLGAALGGFISAYLIPTFGWRSTFVFGGVAPLLIGLLLLWVLPESLRFLHRRPHSTQAIRHILMRIRPSHEVAQASAFIDNEPPTQQGGVALILSRQYWLGSVLLWLCYFMGLVIFYGILNWMPLLLEQSGLGPSAAKLMVSLFALGGLGAIVSGYLMDRYNSNILNAILALLTALFVAAMGWTLQHAVLLLAMVLLGGIAMNTLQASLPMVAALFYPTEGRATGVAWMMGLGRFGAVAGTFLVGALVKADLSLSTILGVLALPALVTFVCLLLKQWVYRR